MGRIEDNEKRLDKLNIIVNDLEKNLDDFEKNIPEYFKLNKYYGSKEWFKDKKDFEKGKIKNIKAGVLSEDSVWDLVEKTNELITRMDEIIKIFNDNKSV